MKPSELIEQPEMWTKKAYARDGKGNRVEALSPDAAKWCVRGAILKCCPDFMAAIAKLRDQLPEGTNITQWNDDPDRDHDEVLEALEAAGL